MVFHPGADRLGAWPASWRTRRENREGLFLLLWALLPFAFFSLSSSKLIPYILPVMPPLALLAARYLAPCWDDVSAAGLRAGTGVLFVLGILLTLALVFVPDNTPDRPRVAEYSRVFGSYAWLILGSLLRGGVGGRG